MAIELKRIAEGHKFIKEFAGGITDEDFRTLFGLPIEKDPGEELENKEQIQRPGFSRMSSDFSDATWPLVLATFQEQYKHFVEDHTHDIVAMAQKLQIAPGQTNRYVPDAWREMRDRFNLYGVFTSFALDFSDWSNSFRNIHINYQIPSEEWGKNLQDIGNFHVNCDSQYIGYLPFHRNLEGLTIGNSGRAYELYENYADFGWSETDEQSPFPVKAKSMLDITYRPDHSPFMRQKVEEEPSSSLLYNFESRFIRNHGGKISLIRYSNVDSGLKGFTPETWVELVSLADQNSVFALPKESY